MVINNVLESYLIEHGFEICEYMNKRSLKKELYAAFTIYIGIEDYDKHVDINSVNVNINITNQEFNNRVLDLYKNHYQIACKYSPKPVVPKWGDFIENSFASALVNFSTEIREETNESFEWSIFESGLIRIHLFELIVNLKLMNNNQNFFDILFRTKLGEFFILNDFQWMFIFILKKMGYSTTHIEAEFQRVYLYRNKKKSNLRVEIDKDIIEVF